MCRNHEIKVRLTTDELEKIKIRSKEFSVEPAVYLRQIGLNSIIRIESPKVPLSFKYKKK